MFSQRTRVVFGFQERVMILKGVGLNMTSDLRRLCFFQSGTSASFLRECFFLPRVFSWYENALRALSTTCLRGAIGIKTVHITPSYMLLLRPVIKAPKIEAEPKAERVKQNSCSCFAPASALPIDPNQVKGFCCGQLKFQSTNCPKQVIGRLNLFCALELVYGLYFLAIFH